MPAIILLLVMLGLAGGVEVSSTNVSESAPSAVLVGGEFGGIVDPETEQVRQTDINIFDNFSQSQTATEEVIVPVPPVVDTYAPQNIQTNRATLRGELIFTDTVESGAVYFVYSTSFREVVANSADAKQLLVSRSYNREGIITRSLAGLTDDTRYYYRLCFELESSICGDVVSFDTVENTSPYTRYRGALATTRDAEDVQAESATLEGTYRLNDSENATAFFVYGTDRTLITAVPTEYDEYQDVREAGEALQRLRAGVGIDPLGTIQRDIDDLEKDTTYYQRFCVSYDDDEETAISCGSVRSFETKRKDRDVPVIRTMNAVVTGSTVQFSSTVDMQDYLDGHVFFVYGTSEQRVTSVESLDEFRRVPQAGDQLQRISIDTDFDGRDSVSNTVRDVTVGDYFYTFCVEYETEDDNGRDDIQLSCDSVETFKISE